ncbi:DUF58 domain-containing protein [Psychrobacter sp. I-STPA6b]|uniref:DUF58 domain-containing protein n=1 Tax=Psychrobacter sp. I-STPA6b TaxID=2585718 RepID=UPI001D0C3536|nr:DUF58 domain-containing protein [Psychrobacter sp. I-STPA6b]
MLNHTNTSEPNQLDELVAQLEPVLKHINLHRFLWGFIVVCAFIAWNRGLMLLYALVAFLLAVMLVSYGFYFINLKGLSLRANLPHDNVLAGEDFAVTVSLQSQWTKHFLAIYLPMIKEYQDPRLAQLNKADNSQSISQPISQSVQTTFRLFILRSQHTQSFECIGQLPRGVYRLSTVQISCAYPLGIVSTQQSFDIDGFIFDGADEGSNNKVYVLPRWFSVANLPNHWANSVGVGNLPSRHKGQHDEFADVRPYRRGDAFKTVHWGASARQVSRGQDLVVKEFDALDKPRILILLNQFDIREPQAFDTMISIALSMGHHLSGQGFGVHLLGFDAPFHSLTDYWQIQLTEQTHPTSDVLRKLAEIDGFYLMTTMATGNSLNSSNNQNNNYGAFISTALNKFSQSNLLISFYAHTPITNSAGSTASHAHCQHCHIYLDKTTQQNHYQQLSDNLSVYRIQPNSTLEQLAQVFGGKTFDNIGNHQNEQAKRTQQQG